MIRRGCAHARTALRNEREDRLVEPGRDDLVVGEHDARAARERVLGDDVDRGRLHLDEIRVGVDARKLLAQEVAPREIAGDVDDLRVEVARSAPGRS